MPQNPPWGLGATGAFAPAVISVAAVLACGTSSRLTIGFAAGAAAAGLAWWDSPAAWRGGGRMLHACVFATKTAMPLAGSARSSGTGIHVTSTRNLRPDMERASTTSWAAWPAAAERRRASHGADGADEGLMLLRLWPMISGPVYPSKSVKSGLMHSTGYGHWTERIADAREQSWQISILETNSGTASMVIRTASIEKSSLWHSLPDTRN
mmetsp:Transcript_4630/g.10254  ORF Transcript_4630/g.10254 Transcript_4630/m.10254 type:complete len:210 (+) Transcript_4630:305-934(+)